MNDAVKTVKLPDGSVKKVKVDESWSLDEIKQRLTKNYQTFQGAKDKIIETAKNKVIEKAEATGIPNALKESGNVVLDKLKYLDSFGNAVGGATAEVYKKWQEPGNHSIGLKPGTTLHTAPSLTGDLGKAALDGAKKGFTYKEYYGAQQLIPENVRNEYPGRSIAAGIVGDIAKDPLTYTPAGVITVPYKGATGVMKALGKTKLVNNRFFRAFNIYGGDAQKIKEAADRFRDFTKGQHFREVKGAVKLEDDLIEISKKADVPLDNLKALITNAIETEDLSKLATLPPDVTKIANNIIKQNRQMLNVERSLGVDIGDLGEGYMGHFLTKEGRAAVNAKDVESFVMGGAMTHASAKTRKLLGTVEEINAKRLYGTKKLFHDDPAVIQASRKFRHAMVLGNKQFMDDVTKQFGIRLDEAPKGYRGLNIVTDNPMSGIVPRHMAFPDDVANVIEEQFKILSSPEDLNAFLRVYDSALGWWKMWSLGARPAYHSRNAVGNAWNAYLAGLKDPQRYADAAQLQHMFTTGEMAGKKIVGKDANELYEAMIDNGILGRGQYHADIGQAVEAEIKHSKPFTRQVTPGEVLTLSTDNALLRGGFKVGGAIENNARMALFLDQVSKGKSYEEAAKTVKKFLFDYDDLSKFEQSVLKRAIPFYTWSRKNIPLQLEAIAESPDKVQKLGIAIRNIEQDTEKPDPEFVQQFQKDLGPVYYSRNKKDDVAKVATLMNYLPFMDVGRFFTPGEFAGMLTPYFKAPVEYFANYDTYREKDIEQKKGETTDFMGVRMPVHLAHLAKNLIMLNEIDRANPFNVFGKSTYDPETGKRERTNSFGMEQERSFSIPLPSYRRRPENETIWPSGKVDKGAFGVGTPREARTDLPGIERFMQYMFGIRPYTVDQEKGKVAKYAKFKQDAVNLRRLLAKEKKAEKKRAAQETYDLLIERIDQLVPEKPTQD